MLVCVVHPVAILSAVFSVICSLLIAVSDASGDHIVEAPNDTAYTRTGKQCTNCVDPSRPQQWGPDYCFLDKPVMRTHWMAGNPPHKSGRCQN